MALPAFLHLAVIAGGRIAILDAAPPDIVSEEYAAEVALCGCGTDGESVLLPVVSADGALEAAWFCWFWRKLSLFRCCGGLELAAFVNFTGTGMKGRKCGWIHSYIGLDRHDTIVWTWECRLR